MNETEASREPKVIKRYTNRKLYDTVESRYVTLDEIAEMVKQGVEVQIVDNKTKEDLTSVTLAQIVFEEEKKKNQMPLSVLRDIIRRPQESVSEFFNTKVTPRVASLKEETAHRLEKILGRDAGEVELTPSDLLKQSQRVFEAWQTRIDERVKAVLENAVGNLPALGRDLSTLIERLEQLEQKVTQLEQQRGDKKDRP